MTDEHEHAMKVWWEALAATGNFVRFNSKSEKAAAAVIAADRAGLVAEIERLRKQVVELAVAKQRLERSVIKAAAPNFMTQGEREALADFVKFLRSTEGAEARAALKEPNHEAEGEL